MEANLHWKYFLTIDQDLSHISRYIEFSKDNFGVYSIELVRLFLSVCAEIDVVMKILCETHCKDQYDKEIKTKRNPNMDVYRLIVTNYFKYFSSVSVEIPKCSISTTPWAEFAKEKNPNWWQEHNKVKHSRNDNYKKANLGNVINASAGLLVAIVYLIAGEKDINIDNVSMPYFFKLPDGFESGGVSWGGAMLVIPERNSS